MSPINKNKLKKLRKSLDNLDNSFIKLVKKRTSIIKQVLKLKESKSQIVDKKRINEIIKKVRNKSITNKIDPQITTRIWKTIISSYIIFQRKNFRKK